MATTILQKVTPLGPHNTFGGELVVLAAEEDGDDTVMLTIPRRVFQQWAQSHRTPTESIESGAVTITFDNNEVEIEEL